MFLNPIKLPALETVHSFGWTVHVSFKKRENKTACSLLHSLSTQVIFLRGRVIMTASQYFIAIEQHFRWIFVVAAHTSLVLIDSKKSRVLRVKMLASLPLFCAVLDVQNIAVAQMSYYSEFLWGMVFVLEASTSYGKSTRRDHRLLNNSNEQIFQL